MLEYIFFPLGTGILDFTASGLAVQKYVSCLEQTQMSTKSEFQIIPEESYSNRTKAEEKSKQNLT
jgi:lipoate-protein ligase B